MNWKMVTVGAGEHRRGAELQSLFEAAFMAAKAPKDAAMFTNHDETHAYRFYFSPGAVRIFGSTLAKWGVVNCRPPASTAVTFLVGHADAPDELPSGHPRR